MVRCNLPGPECLDHREMLMLQLRYFAKQLRQASITLIPAIIMVLM
jgi:hypothetical protein